MVNVTLSCDHRVIDGAMGAEWLQVRVCGGVGGLRGKGGRWKGGGRVQGRVEGQGLLSGRCKRQ